MTLKILVFFSKDHDFHKKAKIIYF